MKKNILLSLLCLQYADSNVLASWSAIGGAEDMTGEDGNTYAGQAVALNDDGTIIAVGERGWSTQKGRVLVYTFTGGSWSAIGGAEDMTGHAGDGYFGNSVAISSDGTIVAVGEAYWSGLRGRVRAYTFAGGSWSAIGGAEDMTGQNQDDEAGSSVSISSDGTIVAVGEYGWPNGDYNGRVRVYTFAGGSWSAIGGAQDMTGEAADDVAGLSVAISSDGTIVAAGEQGWPNGSNKGRVRVYTFTGGSWSAIGGSEDMTGQNGSDYAGYDVAISSDGTIVAVGEIGWPAGGNKGRVRAYTFAGGSWSAIGGAQDMTGQAGGDRAGSSVAISSDGTIVAVGEYGWSGGDFNGRVKAYTFTDGSWSASGGAQDMTGQAGGDRAGQGVAISSDGSIIAVGQFGWPDGNYNGRVLAYKSSLAPSQKNMPISNVFTMRPLALHNPTNPGNLRERMVPVYYLYSLLQPSTGNVQ